MTGRIPYAAARTDSLVIRAIVAGNLPAPIEEIAGPEVGREVLTKCWSFDAKSRPTLKWCAEGLRSAAEELDAGSIEPLEVASASIERSKVSLPSHFPVSI